MVNLSPILLHSPHTNPGNSQQRRISPRTGVGNIAQRTIPKDPERRHLSPFGLSQSPSAQCLLQASLPLRRRRGLSRRRLGQPALRRGKRPRRLTPLFPPSVSSGRSHCIAHNEQVSVTL